jgi:Lrp/AsnC family transcriptional regulator for asnA, asnC and gidA
MATEHEIDKLDRQILSQLQKDARRPFQDIARELVVSGGTVHVRFSKLRESGIIEGSRLIIDQSKLGYDVTAFVGINLQHAGDYKSVVNKLNQIPQIVEAHYTTGKYSIFIKVLAKSTRGLHDFLIEELQAIEGIQSTETLISLEAPIERDVPVND